MKIPHGLARRLEFRVVVIFVSEVSLIAYRLGIFFHFHGLDVSVHKPHRNLAIHDQRHRFGMLEGIVIEMIIVSCGEQGGFEGRAICERFTPCDWEPFSPD